MIGRGRLVVAVFIEAAGFLVGAGRMAFGVAIGLLSVVWISLAVLPNTFAFA